MIDDLQNISENTSLLQNNCHFQPKEFSFLKLKGLTSLHTVGDEFSFTLKYVTRGHLIISCSVKDIQCRMS